MKNIGSFITNAISNSNELLQFTDSNKLEIRTCLPNAGKRKHFFLKLALNKSLKCNI